MSGENDDIENGADEEAEIPRAGERLAHARREQQIPVIDIAKELHLDEYKVRALECNDFDVIGAPVFAKGHLRKYAQLLNVDNSDVMADYYELTRSAGASPALALSVRSKSRQEISPGPWLAVIATVVVVTTAYWWFAVREVAPDDSLPEQVSLLPPENSVTDAELPESEPVDEVETDPLPEISQSEAAADDVATPDSAEMRVSISYTGDSWTEISDARGRRLYFALGKSGQTVDLSGEPPFNVLFGDAANVSLLVNGASYDLPPADRRGTARLTITTP